MKQFGVGAPPAARAAPPRVPVPRKVIAVSGPLAPETGADGSRAADGPSAAEPAANSTRAGGDGRDQPEAKQSRARAETLSAISRLSGPITLELSGAYPTTKAMLRSSGLSGQSDKSEQPERQSDPVEETGEVREAPLPFSGGLAVWIDGDERTLAERVALSFLAGTGGAVQQSLGLALVVPPRTSVPRPPAAFNTLLPESAEGRDGHESGIARPG